MKQKYFFTTLVILLVFLFSGLYNAGTTQDTASAAVSSWQKSASIVPTSQSEYSSQNFRDSLNQLKNTNANYVTLIIPYYQSNPWSTDIQRGWNTPTDESLISGINYAHSIGLNVALKPHMETFDKQWRAYINPSNRNAWFSAYGNMLNHYAGIAQSQNVELYIIGSELISMAADNQNPTNTQNWRNMISAVRGIYSGPVTYSANWGPSGFVDEKNHILFWPQLDYIGIAAYFSLGWDWNNYDVEVLKAEWNNWNQSHITPLQQRWNKPVLFTEIGYRSVDGAHTDPFDSGRGGAPNQQVQANAYEALFSYWDSQPFMQGVHLWDWQPFTSAGGAGTTTYTPQNKLAQGVMQDWFGRTSGDPPPPPPQQASFEVSGSANPAAVSPGTETMLNVSVVATGGAASNVIVNIEVHDNNNNKVFQQYFDGQNFTSGQTRNYNLNWTAQNTGNYTLKTGVFNNSWSTLYIWNNDVAQIAVGGGTPPPPTPPPGSGQIEIWWPGDGVSITGTQPFKALVQNMDLSNYKMFWQVDFDRLNPMFDSSEDWPHKEALVDVSGWSWSSTGKYIINFVAKNLGGSTIAEKFVEIMVAQ